jgi:hypothetical protein
LNEGCRDCKDYRGCIPPEWFNYAEIRFCPYQVLWVIANSDIFRAGHWPKNPNGDDSSGQKGIKAEAAFVKPILILAELESRLERTGIQGKLLVAQIEAGYEFNMLDREARDALFYVKGWRRKRISFIDWKRKRRWLKRTEIVQKEEKCAIVKSVESQQLVASGSATNVS